MVKIRDKARVRVVCSVMCMGMKGLWLELGSSSDLRETVMLMFRVTVGCD